MIQGVILVLFTALLSYIFLGFLSNEGAKSFLLRVFLYHFLLAIAYYVYAIYNPSDSHGYYLMGLNKYYGDNWFDYFGESTKFVEFISFFLVNHLGLNYEASMIFFAWLGYLGFVLFYIFFQEHFKRVPTIFGVDVIKVVFLLPNLHFWSASLGKGALIFFGFGLFFYGLTKPFQRIMALLLGAWIIYMIRPHIFFIVLIAIAIGFTFSTKGAGLVIRIAVLTASAVILSFIYNDILALTGLEDESVFDPLISHRAKELSKATSGIDISNYSVFEKLFAFCFRPLFFDAPGALGFIVSFENLFYLILFANLFRPSCIRYLVASDAITKTCLLTFGGVAFALSQITGNLGLAMRQKSQVMILMMFVILKFLESQQSSLKPGFSKLPFLKRKPRPNRLKPVAHAT